MSAPAARAFLELGVRVDLALDAAGVRARARVARSMACRAAARRGDVVVFDEDRRAEVLRDGCGRRHIERRSARTRASPGVVLRVSVMRVAEPLGEGVDEAAGSWWRRR